MERVLFVCESNCVRSPAAEVIAKKQAQNLGLGIEFASAGLNPRFGYMPDEIKEALKRMGYPPPSTFTPRKLTPELLTGQDLVLCFEQDQIFSVQEVLPSFTKPVRTLSAFAGEPGQEIPDLTLVRNTLLSQMAFNLPITTLRHLAYLSTGIHPDDKEALIQANIQTARVIEGYIGNVLERITA